MKSKLKAIVKILTCKSFFICTKHETGTNFMHSMTEKETIRIAAFWINFTENGNEALNEAKSILNQDKQ